MILKNWRKLRSAVPRLHIVFWKMDYESGVTKKTEFFAICNLLLELQKPPAPVALQNKKVVVFHSRSKNDGIMVIFGSGAESRPAWTRMVAVVYGSEGGELGFPSAAQ